MRLSTRKSALFTVLLVKTIPIAVATAKTESKTNVYISITKLLFVCQTRYPNLKMPSSPTPFFFLLPHRENKNGYFLYRMDSLGVVVYYNLYFFYPFSVCNFKDISVLHHVVQANQRSWLIQSGKYGGSDLVTFAASSLNG